MNATLRIPSKVAGARETVGVLFVISDMSLMTVAMLFWYLSKNSLNNYISLNILK